MYAARKTAHSTGLFLTLSAAMLLLAMVSQQPWAEGPRGAAKSALSPLEDALTALGTQVDHLTSMFGDVTMLRDENLRLRTADEQLRRQVIELQAAAQENAALRQALDFEKTSGHKMVAATIVGRGPDGFSQTIEVDRGTADGVRPGMVVVTGAGLLGRIKEAGPHMAIVQTLSDPETRVSIFLSISNLEGIVTGGPRALRIDIQHSLGVVPANGEWALTSGAGGYPRGLVVGEVANVTRRDTATSDVADLGWVNDPATLTFVLVITDLAPS